MRKDQVTITALIIFFIVSMISIGLNIRHASEQEHIRKNMINHVYSELTTISLNLNGLIGNIEEVTDYETNQQSLTMLSTHFTKLDTILTWYARIFPPKGTVRNVYAGTMFNFDYISYTLTAGTGVANDTRYSGITADGIISESEMLYLKALRDDIDVLVAAMVSPVNPPQENENLTTEQIDRILETFFDKWSYHHEGSPYHLLRSK